MLDINDRNCLTTALTPPPGMVFEEAIATTYSLDPRVLMEVPVHLSAWEWTNDGTSNNDPIKAFEAVRRFSDKISVYVQNAKIYAPKMTRPSLVFSLLETMIVEVAAPGDGVFHPKIWLLRFSDGQDDLYRLIVLTRNITRDYSWDIIVQIEGRPEISGNGRPKPNKMNEPLCFFLSKLPGLAKRRITKDKVKQAERFASVLRHVHWDLPKGYDCRYFLNGFEKHGWKIPDTDQLIVVSPFCSDAALERLASKGANNLALISCADEFRKLKQPTLDRFDKCYCFNDHAIYEDGETTENDELPLSKDLHAKLLLYQTKGSSNGYAHPRTHIVTGSANATNSAMLPMGASTANVEFMVELNAPPGKLGRIENFLENNLNPLLTEYSRVEKPQENEDIQENRRLIDDAVKIISGLDLSLECRRENEAQNWDLVLHGHIPPLDGIDSLTAHPLTASTNEKATELLDSESGQHLIGEYPATMLTGLLVFNVSVDSETDRFVVNLPVENLPIDERRTGIFRNIIGNRDDFVRYLLLLLSDFSGEGHFPSSMTTGKRWLSNRSFDKEPPLLEILTRACSRHPEQLKTLADVIDDLSRSEKHVESNVFPGHFLDLWKKFAPLINDEK